MKLWPLLLLLLLLCSPLLADTTFAELEKEFYRLVNAHFDGKGPHPVAALAERVLDFEETHRHTEEGLKILLMLAGSAGSPTPELDSLCRTVDQRLLTVYLDRESLGPRLQELTLQRPELLQKISEDSQSSPNRAWALYFLGRAAMWQDREEECRGFWTQVLNEYGELPGPNDKPFAETVKFQLYVLDNLRPGKQAPEISGVDSDGCPLTLSDFRGKVVLLAFWGHW